MFTDGACRGNPGPGGWGVLLRMGDKERELSGGEPLTTNNRMELLAAIKGLEALKTPVPGRAAHRQHLRSRRDHSLGPQLAAQRLAHLRQEAGQECRAVAGADRRSGAAPHRMALGEGPQRPPRKRPRRCARLRRGGRPAAAPSPVNQSSLSIRGVAHYGRPATEAPPFPDRMVGEGGATPRLPLPAQRCLPDCYVQPDFGRVEPTHELRWLSACLALIFS